MPGRRVIDLSLTLGGPLISSLRGVPTFEKQPVHTHAEHGRSNTRVAFNIHTATHVDCPYHFVPDGATVDRVPLEAYMGSAVRADVRALVGPGEGVTVEHFRDALPPDVPLRGAIVIMHTGWLARAWGQEHYYLDNPYLTEDGARWLVAQGVKAVGVDCSVERAVGANPPRHGDSPIHRILLPAGVMLIENLANLEQLPVSGFELWALPIKLFEGDGAPCRAVAILEGLIVSESQDEPSRAVENAEQKLPAGGVDEVFDLGDSGGSDVAAHKDLYLGVAVQEERRTVQ